MARTNIYGERTWRSLKFKAVDAGTEFTYLFRSNVPATEVNDLGQTPITATPTTGAIISAARFPTPHKVYNQQKGIRTFCASDKVSIVKARGWQVTARPKTMKKRIQTPPTAGAQPQGSILVYVAAKSGAATGNTNILFAWFMPKQQWVKLTDAIRTSLGISLPADADWKNLCLGVGTKKSGPRPGRASTTITTPAGTDGTGGSLDTVSTFYGEGATLPEGWVSVEQPIFLEI